MIDRRASGSLNPVNTTVQWARSDSSRITNQPYPPAVCHQESKYLVRHLTLWLTRVQAEFLAFYTATSPSFVHNVHVGKETGDTKNEMKPAVDISECRVTVTHEANKHFVRGPSRLQLSVFKIFRCCHISLPLTPVPYMKGLLMHYRARGST